MIELDSDEPYFHWTFDLFDDLVEHRSNEGFGSEVWKRNEIPGHCAIRDDFVAFDAPEEWKLGTTTVHMTKTVAGYYEHRSTGHAYEAARADTDTQVILTGRWTQDNFGKGVFVVVLPRGCASSKIAGKSGIEGR